MIRNPFYLSTAGESFWEHISDWYRNSLFHELFAFIEERYFTVRFDVYENFSLGSNAASTARNIILGLTFGIIIASLLTAYTHTVLGKFIRALIKSDTMSKEKAKTLSELGFFRSSAIRRELSHGVNLRKVVRCVEEEQYLLSTSIDKTTSSESSESTVRQTKSVAKQFRIDFTNMHFYLPEELHYRADVRFDRAGSGWLLATATVILAFVLAGILCWFLPDIFRLIDNLISYTAP